MNEKYWFARGYFDGRNSGKMDEDLIADGFTGSAYQSYKDGYEFGVADYCNYDIPAENLSDTKRSY